MAEEPEVGTGLTAPYTAFSSIRTAARTMKEHGLPGRIDRSVLTNFSGSVASQIMQAFKFLGLTTDAGEPTASLKALVDAADDDGNWAKALAPILLKAYGPMFTMNLEAASPSQFLQHFRKHYPGAEAVSRKSLTFFLNAVQDAKIPISSYILKNKKSREGAPKKRAQKGPNTPGRTQVDDVVNGANGGGGSGRSNGAGHVQKSQSETLLALFDPAMKQPEQDAIWTLIKFFRTKGL